MGEVLSYPLTPVPLSLCHVDGSIQKSQKSALLNYLESKMISVPPTTVNVTIIDAMFFLHLNSNLPSTFGGVARYLLSRIMKSDGDTVHFVSDKWIKPSIKDCERDNRAADIGSISYQIKGANQKRPSNWLSTLSDSSFKNSLMAFLVDCWQDDEYAYLFGGKKLFVICNDNCYQYYSLNEKVIRSEAAALHSTHEEADSRMFFHLNLVQPPSNVDIRIADTDCLGIALAHVSLLTMIR
jgi:hypothetical protein